MSWMLLFFSGNILPRSCLDCISVSWIQEVDNNFVWLLNPYLSSITLYVWDSRKNSCCYPLFMTLHSVQLIFIQLLLLWLPGSLTSSMIVQFPSGWTIHLNNILSADLSGMLLFCTVSLWTKVLNICLMVALWELHPETYTNFWSSIPLHSV